MKNLNKESRFFGRFLPDYVGQAGAPFRMTMKAFSSIPRVKCNAA
jgi:hypothetical protein